MKIQPLPTDRIINVFSDYKEVKENLTDERFSITDDIEKADIIWLSTAFKDFKCEIIYLFISVLSQVQNIPLLISLFLFLSLSSSLPDALLRV